MKFENAIMLLAGRVLATGSIEIAGERIVAINRYPVADPQLLVMPGLWNCHGHTPMTLVRGLGGGLPLQRWLEEAIFPVEAKMTPSQVKLGMTFGIMEMFAGGTVFVADMYDFPAECIKALKASGMKGKVGRVGLSFIPGRLEDCIEFTRQNLDWADLCIHSEYLTDEDFCRKLAAANRELKRRLNFHVSETEKEHLECLRRHGKTPIAYLNDTGLLDFGGYAAHCVYCTDDDFKIMAEKQVSMVHNPSSNMKLGSGFARVQRARELGVNVALGTDGAASNDNLDMFEEMHLAALIHKGITKDPTVLSAWEVIEMATKNGALAMGVKDSGELKVGNRADLCVLALNKPHLTPCLNAANLIVYSAHASDVVTTVIDGKVVYDHGVYPTIDAEKTTNEFSLAVKELFK